MTKELLERQETSPAEMIRIAVAGGADLEKLKGLLDLQIQYEANEAKKAYARDFAIAQANIIPVVKSKYNQQTKSKYSDLSDVIETTQPIYTKEGFAVTFDEADCPLPEHVRITAEVLHCKGHKRDYHFDVPLDGKGMQGNTNMTKIHGKASSIAYGRRYLMCMIWNIPTADDDGNKASSDIKYISEWQIEDLQKLLKENELNEASPGFLKYMGVDKMENILEKDYKKAEIAIKSAKKVTK